MTLLGVFVLVLFHLSQAFSVPVETVIVQVQQWVVVGTQQLEEQVLFNGVPLTGERQKFNNIVQTISTDDFPAGLIHTNQTSLPKNHIVLRARECILEGSELHWTDQIFYDGKVYLTLDHTGTWTAHVPQALAFKVLWAEDLQQTKTDKTCLKEKCSNLLRKIKLLEEQPGIPLPRILIPILALSAFTGLIFISFFLSKNCGFRHPGGVIGSIIHYPMDMSQLSSNTNSNGYHTV
ncbi:uncharacterized protein LOC115058012 [Echeneis naucrates]|uniref:uncharacterized protein LOC115058012 n=1 Tax=Echeneis naucrates TaxID=173247 RepID=UPI001113535B|nr:uncharacterized protein LOC115058012 [Echeneis naucrates]